MTYNNIPVDDSKLIIMVILASVLLVILLACCGVYIAFIYLPITRDEIEKSKKEKNRIKNLKEKSIQDNLIAQKQLDKLYRKRKRRNRKQINNRIGLYVVLAVLVIIISIWYIPMIKDLCYKDYSVYTGEFEVCIRSRQRRYTVLSDGTHLDGGLNLEQGKYNGTVIYSTRSKIAICYIEE